MTFGDPDDALRQAAAERASLLDKIDRLGVQLTTMQVQMAEVRSEIVALRRDLDRVYNNHGNGTRVVTTDKLPYWLLALAMLTIAILLVVYLGGRAGV